MAGGSTKSVTNQEKIAVPTAEVPRKLELFQYEFKMVRRRMLVSSLKLHTSDPSTQKSCVLTVMSIQKVSTENTSFEDIPIVYMVR